MIFNVPNTYICVYCGAWRPCAAPDRPRGQCSPAAAHRNSLQQCQSLISLFIVHMSQNTHRDARLEPRQQPTGGGWASLLACGLKRNKTLVNAVTRRFNYLRIACVALQTVGNPRLPVPCPTTWNAAVNELCAPASADHSIYHVSSNAQGSRLQALRLHWRHLRARQGRCVMKRQGSPALPPRCAIWDLLRACMPAG